MAGIKIKRPKLISILCIIGWIIVIISFLIAFSPGVKKIGNFYPALCSLVVSMQFISLVGIWYMKRWGVNLFVLTFFAQNILYVFMNYFQTKGGVAGISVFFSVICSLYIVILLFYYKRMDLNL